MGEEGLDQPFPVFSISNVLPSHQLSNVPWRRLGVKYTNNEAYFDLIEEIDAIIDRNGSTIMCEIQGYVSEAKLGDVSFRDHSPSFIRQQSRWSISDSPDARTTIVHCSSLGGECSCCKPSSLFRSIVVWSWAACRISPCSSSIRDCWTMWVFIRVCDWRNGR